MSKTYYLIALNSNGSISYLASGSYHAMKKLDREAWHVVTSISDYSKAVLKFGINR